MLAKILKSNHSGVQVGDVGEVVKDYGSGVAIRLRTTYSDLFGGQTKTRWADIFFSKDEVEFLPKTKPETESELDHGCQAS